jgi:hypothetical protein
MFLDRSSLKTGLLLTWRLMPKTPYPVACYCRSVIVRRNILSVTKRIAEFFYRLFDFRLDAVPTLPAKAGRIT